MKRLLRQGHTVLLRVLQLTPNGPEPDSDPPEPPDPWASVPQEVQLLLRELEDEFQPLQELPPERGVQHAIPIEPGARPPFRPMLDTRVSSQGLD